MNDDEDADLQRALALSLQHDDRNVNVQDSQQANNETDRNTDIVDNDDKDVTDEDDDDDELAAALQLSLQKNDVDGGNDNYPPTNVLVNMNDSLFHTLEPVALPDTFHYSPRVLQSYESSTSTNILDCHSVIWDSAITTQNDQRRWLAQAIDFKSKSGNPDVHPGAQESLLGAIICHSELWGLTQTHGGPCGVLASLQAELMRLLLFGPRISDGLLPVHIPTHLTNHFCQAKPDLSPSFLTSALALSIGIVLARAALQPSASLNDESYRPSGDEEDFTPPVAVRLVFPKTPYSINQLEWQQLQPWPSDEIMGSGVSEHLVTYTISLDENRDSKRQKRYSNLEEREELLAQAVAEFLLETQMIQWYHRQGGVLLFVLALVETRGTANIQADMDDPTARLTSQFGHCSQELINLLLTGQAGKLAKQHNTKIIFLRFFLLFILSSSYLFHKVSNVFDHTLRPSGELVCRGIQKRPVIGYLTQLESMRYLEVGGYYKTPEFPIWVIGSTSHFTVLFGDASCLEESASDQILERVRRAFKQMDGGEEQGFIQLEQLGDFLRKLGLYERLGDHGIQTLGASMEISGAGILLWEDVWKRVSRLLTGASLNSVLTMDDGTSVTSMVSHHETTTGHPSDQALGAQINPLSDEEYARRLQAEWNGESIPAPSPSPSPQVQSSTGPSISSKTKFGTTFQLYHYNGLRGGNMKSFRVTRLSSEEAIGASVSLGSSQSHGGSGGGSSSGGRSSVLLETGLEDVLRTKWPSCKIDWLNGVPPSID